MVDEAFVFFDESHLSSGPIAARIGEQVKSWREEAGLSEADLASFLQLSVEALRLAENGDPCFTAEQIVTICQTFAIKPSRFLAHIL